MDTQPGYPIPPGRFVSTLLLGVIVVLSLTGLVTQYGTWLPWLNDLHRIAGAALIILLPWKATTVYHSLRRESEKTVRRRAGCISSFILALLTFLVIAFGMLWMWRLGPYSSLSQTLIAWHWILGLAMAPFLIVHIRRQWPRNQRDDRLSRRSILQLLGLAGGSVLFGKLAALAAEAQATVESPRRFTGSRGFGSYSGNDFPFTGESTVILTPDQWRLTVIGSVWSPLTLTYAELLALQRQTLTEAIDCHNGWYSVQDWQGISLANLLDLARVKEGVAGVRLISATGLSDTFPIAEARRILLATHATGQVLEPRHGFPLRAVVPGRRGWFWLKWLTQVEVLKNPLEVVGDILCTPLQVFREVDGR